jgi:hypothetical protein
MRTLMKIGLGMLMLAVVLIGVSFGVLRAEDVGDVHADAGKHVFTSETRKVDGSVVAIDMNGPVDLILKQGATASMVVQADQRYIARIKTVQQGDTLRIDAEDGFFHSHWPLRVELTLPNLHKLDLHGSGDGTISGFSGDKLALNLRGSGDIRFNGQYQHVSAGVFGSGDLQLALGNTNDVDLDLQGSGDISASGQSKTLSARILGSGDLDTTDMQADVVKVDVLGSGDSNVYAKQSIAIDLKGSGDIDVHGNPTQRVVNRMGSGDISWAGN